MFARIIGAGRCLARTSLQSGLEGLWGARGSQLVEFALTLPFLLVLSVGVSDFGGAYNLKQKLNNAAREGARYAVSQYSDSGSLSDTSCGGSPCSVQAIENVVVNYLINAKVTTSTTDVCGMTASTSATAGPGVFTWTYTSSNCPGTSTPFTLKIERGYTFLNGTTTVVGSRVTLTYPYSWSFGRIMGLLVPGASPVLPTTLTSDAVMQNLF